MATTSKAKNTYEGLFLFPQSVTANLQEAIDHLQGFLDRAEAEVISMRKWDERKLAYDIKGNKRGVYFLVYFKAPAEKMQQLDRDCNLSELMLRAMLLRVDHIPAEVMEAAEGRAQLEDEIRMRGEQGPEVAESTGSAVVSSRSEREAQKAEAAGKPQAEPDAAEDKPAGTGDEPEPAVAGASEKSDS